MAAIVAPSTIKANSQRNVGLTAAAANAPPIRPIRMVKRAARPAGARHRRCALVAGGQAYQSMGDLERAADDFRKAVKTSPRAHIRRMAAVKLKALTGSV